MVTVVSTSLQQYQILNPIDIEYGATPDRYTKGMLLRCVQIRPEDVEQDGQGVTFDYMAPVTIQVFVKDGAARAKRQEPQQLVKIEKKLIEFLNINKFSLIPDGISHMKVTRSSIIPIDENEYGESNWFRLDVNIELQYRLKTQAL